MDEWKNTSLCKNRVAGAQIKRAKPWLSFDSGREVVEESARLKKLKISVEWIGNLDKRRLTIGPFEDVNTQDLTNTYVEFLLDDAQIYKYKRKLKQDNGVQADVETNVRGTQTVADRLQIKDSSGGGNLEKIQTDENLGEQFVIDEESKVDEKMADEATTSKISNPYLNYSYFKSYVNMTNRNKMISSVAWHPTRIGCVAIAYVDKYKISDSSDLLSIDYESCKNNLASKVVKCVNEDDVKINDTIFDKLSRKDNRQKMYESNGNMSDTSDDVEDEQEDDTIHLARPPFKMHDKSMLYESTSEFVERKIIDGEEIVASQMNEQWMAKFDQMKKQMKNTEFNSNIDDENDDNAVAETNCKNDTSEFELYSLPNLPLCQESISEDSCSAEERSSSTALASDSSILIWNYDDDIHPCTILQDKYEITTIKFDPFNGDFLAGGGRSGQLVLWRTDENDFAISYGHATARERTTIVEEFLENIEINPMYENNDATRRRPTAVSERKISHSQPVTCVEWMHPCLQVTADGKLTNVAADGRLSKQIITSSTDGIVKVWQLNANSPKMDNVREDDDLKFTNRHRLSLQLIFNLTITNPYDANYVTSVKLFKFIFPPVTYTKRVEKSNASRNTDYEFVSELGGKFRQQIMVANDIGELGLISWCDEKTTDSTTVGSAKSTVCKHLWWKYCHDDEITSLSQHYRIPNLILATGGRILAVWDTEYKNGPVWSRKYAENDIILHGCFSPFHLGIIYIAKRDGKIDVWSIFEKIHKPAAVWNASGFAISVLSAIVPPINTLCPLSIADENGVFHILKYQHEMMSSVDDDKTMLKNAEKFFQQAKEKRKRCKRWNKTWKYVTTVTDEHNFERKFCQKYMENESSTVHRNEIRNEYQSVEQRLKKPLFIEQIRASADYANKLDDVFEKIKFLNQPDEQFAQFKLEILQSKIRKTS